MTSFFPSVFFPLYCFPFRHPHFPPAVSYYPLYPHVPNAHPIPLPLFSSSGEKQKVMIPPDTGNKILDGG